MFHECVLIQGYDFFTEGIIDGVVYPELRDRMILMRGIFFFYVSQQVDQLVVRSAN